MHHQSKKCFHNCDIIYQTDNTNGTDNSANQCFQIIKQLCHRTGVSCCIHYQYHIFMAKTAPDNNGTITSLQTSLSVILENWLDKWDSFCYGYQIRRLVDMGVHTFSPYQVAACFSEKHFHWAG